MPAATATTFSRSKSLRPRQQHRNHRALKKTFSQRHQEQCSICEDLDMDTRESRVECFRCNESVCRAHAGRVGRVKGLSRDAPKQRLCDNCYDHISKRKKKSSSSSKKSSSTSSAKLNIPIQHLEAAQGKESHTDIMNRFNMSRQLSETGSGTTEDTLSYYSVKSKANSSRSYNSSKSSSSSSKYRRKRSQMITVDSFNEADEAEEARLQAKLAVLQKKASKVASDNVLLEKKLENAELIKSRERIELRRVVDELEELSEDGGEADDGEDYDLEIQNGGPAARYRVRGKKALRRGDYNSALMEFKRAVKVDMDDAMNFYFLGKAFYGLELYDEAYEAGQKALDEDGSSHLACILLGHVSRAEGDFEEAVEMYQKAIDLKEAARYKARRRRSTGPKGGGRRQAAASGASAYKLKSASSRRDLGPKWSIV